jgi:hypothetical protein
MDLYGSWKPGKSKLRTFNDAVTALLSSRIVQALPGGTGNPKNVFVFERTLKGKK